MKNSKENFFFFSWTLLRNVLSMPLFMTTVPRPVANWNRSGIVWGFVSFIFFSHVGISFRFPVLQHFGAGSCHFNGICNILELEPLVFQGVCNILALERFMLHGIM